MPVARSFALRTVPDKGKHAFKKLGALLPVLLMSLYLSNSRSRGLRLSVCFLGYTHVFLRPMLVPPLWRQGIDTSCSFEEPARRMSASENQISLTSAASGKAKFWRARSLSI